MSRLVIVSNRVARPHESRAGGLASALNASLVERGGLWFGWSGRVVDTDPGEARFERTGNTEFALTDLSREEYDTYYQGFSNRTLWPLLHFRPDLLEFRRRNLLGYRAVNRRFAAELAPHLRTDDTIWVHDYHLIPLGQELRALGIEARIGFFLHVPVPSQEVLVVLPGHQQLLETLCAYDVVGLQTAADLRSLRNYFIREMRASLDDAGLLSVPGEGRFQTEAFPISVDPDMIAGHAELAMKSKANRNLVASLSGRALAISVDRLDYSKGLPERFQAFARFLDAYPQHRNQVSMMQIAPVSRSDVPEYQELRAHLEQLAGSINGEFAEPDWVPIRYINRSFHQATLAGFYRSARVGLVTPLRDGMNLVAKEYVAAQSAHDPGVLVLSKFAGAARELHEALLVNPYDADDTADALHEALRMPLDERRQRWSTMNERLQRNTIAAWRESFLEALARH